MMVSVSVFVWGMAVGSLRVDTSFVKYRLQ